jgi:hypothetical protein
MDYYCCGTVLQEMDWGLLLKRTQEGKTDNTGDEERE